MTPTELKLMVVYKSPVIKLVDICEPYLKWKPPYAKRRALAQSLPFPAFRPTPSQRSPWLIKLEDLAAFIDSQNDGAKAQWINSQV